MSCGRVGIDVLTPTSYVHSRIPAGFEIVFGATSLDEEVYIQAPSFQEAALVLKQLQSDVNGIPYFVVVSFFYSGRNVRQPHFTERGVAS